ncbi:IS5 family transposase [Streptomyces shenzhenensis]|uniref:IS5/IS1182 family transposase n=1 Tax=Streptomyces shenzhenensis TaxID=943815 RepID=A0A3M0HVD3_9ACTN|nr:IS5 family transposase [Streptomyces shenzhenensis]RMB81431.1 IS5/IS1182 family transposase [Streptomyces shenzhenensis]
MGRGGLTDVEWERLRPFLPVSNRRCGRWRDHRQVIDGILHRVRTGVQWRDLPERFGPWKTAYERHRLWSADGTWERLLQQVQAEADAADDIDWDVSVDSTIVRAHQHAAGARTDPPSASKGGWARKTPGRDAVAEPRRPPGGGGAGGEGLGRSRGGFTTKVHLSADGRCRPLSLVVTPGQRADCTQFEPVLEKIRVPRIGPGRPRKKPDSLAADKAYSNGPCRAYPRERGIRHTIPEKTDSQAARLRKGSRGGRPPGFDEERYKKRNTVERAINKLKNARAVATRYDKRGYVYLGTITAAALVISLHT